VRSDIDINADVEILELGIDQRLMPTAADTGLERTVATGTRSTDF